MIDSVFTSIFSLRAVMRHNEEYMKETARELDVFPMDLLVLMELNANYDMHHARDLVKELRVSKGRISESVDRLEKSGLLSKHQVEEDRRKTELTLTDKARDIVRKAEVSFRKLQDIVFKDFTNEDMNEFRRLSGMLTANIESDK